MIRPKCWHAPGRGAGPELVIYSSSNDVATPDRMALLNGDAYALASHGHGGSQHVAECSREKH